MIQYYIKCIRCGGDGEVKFLEETIDYWPRYEWTICPQCHGEKYIPVKLSKILALHAKNPDPQEALKEAM